MAVRCGAKAIPQDVGRRGEGGLVGDGNMHGGFFDSVRVPHGDEVPHGVCESSTGEVESGQIETCPVGGALVAGINPVTHRRYG